MGLSNKELSANNRQLILYNTIASVLWSVLAFTPVTWLCYNYLSHQLLYTFIAVSIVPAIIPNSYLHKLEFKSTVIYKKLGVNVINDLAQNGSLINALIKRKYPAYQGVRYNRSSINRLINQTYVNEKFHWCMFMFFIMVMVYALINALWLWAIFVLIANVFYNVYPNLLQHYIRVKLKSFR